MTDKQIIINKQTYKLKLVSELLSLKRLFDIKTYSKMLHCVYYKKNNVFIVDSTDAY